MSAESHPIFVAPVRDCLKSKILIEKACTFGGNGMEKWGCKMMKPIRVI
jgi:hypothetical protein